LSGEISLHRQNLGRTDRLIVLNAPYEVIEHPEIHFLLNNVGNPGSKPVGTKQRFNHTTHFADLGRLF
tara:strand:- start:457 stop:660 length:204 start_codon:yes stop_codon:yes gene_type:complete